MCESPLAVPRRELEERVLGEVRGRVLTPDNVGRAIERALDLVRREVAARVAARSSVPVDEARLRSVAERWAVDARATLESSPEDCRRAFGGLLGGRRMAVHADPERGFRVEGLFDVPWTQEAPPESVDSRRGITGSGGGI